MYILDTDGSVARLKSLHGGNFNASSSVKISVNMEIFDGLYRSKDIDVSSLWTGWFSCEISWASINEGLK